MSKIRAFIFVFILCVSLSLISSAQIACNITQKVQISCKNILQNRITDDSLKTHSSGENVTITITSSEKLGGVYIKYNGKASCGVLDGSEPVGENGFLHEFIPLKDSFTATLFYEYADICDLFVFGDGEIPPHIQLWQKPKGQTDLLLYPTHSDDDQLFFAGVLPYYAAVKGANVVVAYFANHFDTYNRTHELLDGLWECGVTNYPEIPPFPDGWSESIGEAVSFLEKGGFSYGDIIAYQKALIEKYKPLVVVLHDFNGEYGHGAHMLCTKSFVEAVENHDGYIPEKIYVHLYQENKIVLDIDTPYEQLSGLSPFQVSQKAFLHHKSQHWTWLYGWIYGKNGNITSSKQIKIYNPAHYGLYFSRVGSDTEKNCFLENITLVRDREIALPKNNDRDFTTQKTRTLITDNTLNDSVRSPFHVAAAIISAATALLLFFVVIIKKKR